MDERQPSPPGFLESLRGLGANLLGTAHDRIELFTVELHEEKIRLVQLLIWIGAIGFAGVMATTFVTLTLVYLFWDSARLAVLVGLALFYVAALTGIALAFRRYLARQPRPFDGTLQELREDRACMQNEN
ncbi:MAG: phage holin family protein [Lacunisphaera sp.]